MDDRDLMKIIQLAREGKIISRIRDEDFPSYDYWEIYWAVNAGGEKSSQGVKRMITNRLKKLETAKGEDRAELVKEIGGLVWYLYRRYQDSQSKLERVRKAIQE